MAPRKGKVQQEQVQVHLGPQVREGEVVFGVAHIFASFNDTFVHVTDLSGRYVSESCTYFPPPRIALSPHLTTVCGRLITEIYSNLSPVWHTRTGSFLFFLLPHTLLLHLFQFQLKFSIKSYRLSSNYHKCSHTQKCF